jgi:hypothetical protein
LDANANGSPSDFDPSDFTEGANEILLGLDREVVMDFADDLTTSLEEGLRKDFDHLERMVRDNVRNRGTHVLAMTRDAYRLARILFDGLDEYRGADHD